MTWEEDMEEIKEEQLDFGKEWYDITHYKHELSMVIYRMDGGLIKMKEYGAVLGICLDAGELGDIVRVTHPSWDDFFWQRIEGLWDSMPEKSKEWVRTIAKERGVILHESCK